MPLILQGDFPTNYNSSYVSVDVNSVRHLTMPPKLTYDDATRAFIYNTFDLLEEVAPLSRPTPECSTR